MAGAKGRSGGARPGSGRKPKGYVAPPAADRPKRQFRDQPCSVYVVHEAEERGVCKVGIALSAAKRFSSLQVGTWRVLVLAHEERLGSEEYAHAVERIVHRALAPLHCRGEWFRVTPERAIEEVRIATAQIRSAFSEAESAMARLMEVGP